MLPSKLNTQPAEKSIDFFSELSKIIKSTAVDTATTATTVTTSDSDINAPEPSNSIIYTPPPASSSSYDNICLISKEPLHPNHITLVCNHKFNYIPIYKEVF